MHDIRMLGFHVGQFARNSYFVQLLFTTALGMVALQALAARAPGAIHSDLGWLRAGMVGTWTMCAVATGLIGFQRFQGTLVHLMRTPHAAIRTLLPVVGAASVFGLASLPLAALAAWLFRLPVAVGPLPAMLLAGVLFWLACLAVSSAVGMLFVLTPNAITYEGLIGIPLVLVSGVFGTPPFLPHAVLQAARILPTRSAVELLIEVTEGSAFSWPLAAEVLGISMLWLVLAGFIAGVVTKRATASGTLEMI